MNVNFTLRIRLETKRDPDAEPGFVQFLYRLRVEGSEGEELAKWIAWEPLCDRGLHEFGLKGLVASVTYEGKEKVH